MLYSHPAFTSTIYTHLYNLKFPALPNAPYPKLLQQPLNPTLSYGLFFLSYTHTYSHLTLNSPIHPKVYYVPLYPYPPLPYKLYTPLHYTLGCTSRLLEVCQLNGDIYLQLVNSVDYIFFIIKLESSRISCGKLFV